METMYLQIKCKGMTFSSIDLAVLTITRCSDDTTACLSTLQSHDTIMLVLSVM